MPRHIETNDEINQTQDGQLDWPDLIPLNRSVDPPQLDPVTMLPSNMPELSALMDGAAEALQVPREMVVTIIVGLASLACARDVEVQCDSKWKEPANLWFLTLMRPGERKSASMSLLLTPIWEWMKNERERLTEPLSRYAEKRRGIESMLAAIRGRMAKEKNYETRIALGREASDLAADLDAMPSRLAAPDLLVQSYTPEALRDTLESNGEKIGIVSAEADAGEMLGTRYSDAPNIDLLLNAHAGDPIKTNRAGNRTVFLERPAVCMVLAVQPVAILSVLSDRLAKGRGLIDRMLFVCPTSRLGKRKLDPIPIQENLLAWWGERIKAVLDLPWPGRTIIGHMGEPMRCTSTSRILTLHPLARQYLWDLRLKIEPRLADGEDLSAISGFASKLSGACARIALVFTILNDPRADQVSAEAMRAACAWAPFLLAHHQKVLGEAVEPPEVHHARRLWRAIQKRGRTIMSARDLFKLVYDSALPDMKAFEPVLALMVEHGAVQHLQNGEGGAGRPSERYAVNPLLLPDAG